MLVSYVDDPKFNDVVKIKRIRTARAPMNEILSVQCQVWSFKVIPNGMYTTSIHIVKTPSKNINFQRKIFFFF